jgi:DNA-binding SARP family transcriptional activator
VARDRPSGINANGARASAPGGALLRLRGTPAVVTAAGAITDLEIKDALLLAYVALDGPVARTELATRLWPDSALERARASLRQRLMRLRKQLGTDLLTAGDPVQLQDVVQHDLDATGDVLAPVALADAGGFAEWLADTRRARRVLRADALAAAAARAEGAGELAAAIEHAQALIALDPLSEHAHRRLIRLHYLRGDLGAARAAYVRCAQALARDLGVSPSAETEALLQQIERGEAAAVRGPPPVTLLRPPALVGREEPLQRLRATWAEGRVFVVIGEAGIGKSRLIDDFVAGEPGYVVVAGRPGDRSVPLALLARLVRVLGSRMPVLAQHPRYAELLALLPGGAEAPDGQRPRRVGALLGALIGAEGSAAGIVIDDLQWVDDASIEALRDARALETGGHTRWGFASRPAEDESADQRLGGIVADHAAETITLAQLDLRMLEDLVTSLQPASADAAAAARRLQAMVGGNPFFVLEVLRQLHAASGDWTRVQVPTRVADLMDRRLANLSDGAMMLARVAAIAGAAFSAELAEAVTGLDALALADPWRELEAGQILRGAAFTHDLALAAVQRSIPHSIAARVHAKAARHLESAGADPARIAEHHLAAGQELQAVPFLLAAARQAGKAACSRESTAFFFKAGDIELDAGHPDAAFDVFFEAAYAAYMSGTAEQVAHACGMLTRLARTPTQRARALLGETATWTARGGDLEGLARRIDAALLQAIAADERLVEAECRSFKAELSLAQRRPMQETIEHLAASERMFREIGRQDRSLALQTALATMLGFAGHCERALEVLRTLTPEHPLLSQAGWRAQEATFALNLGRLAHARAAAEAAASLLQKFDVADVDWPGQTVNTAAIFRRLGDYARALQVLDTVGARFGGHSPHASALQAERAAIYLDLGRPDLAARAFALFEADATGQRFVLNRLQLGRAALLGAAGKGTALAELESLDPLSFPILRSSFEWLFERGRHRATAPALDLARVLLERGDGPKLTGLRVTTLAVMAKFHTELGDRDAALRCAEEALQLLDACAPCLLPLTCSALKASFDAAGRTLEARGSMRIACEWIERTARETVPAEFRDSFRERNPLNRQLLLAATHA